MKSLSLVCLLIGVVLAQDDAGVPPAAPEQPPPPPPDVPPPEPQPQILIATGPCSATPPPAGLQTILAGLKGDQAFTDALKNHDYNSLSASVNAAIVASSLDDASKAEALAWVAGNVLPQALYDTLRSLTQDAQQTLAGIASDLPNAEAFILSLIADPAAQAQVKSFLDGKIASASAKGCTYDFSSIDSISGTGNGGSSGHHKKGDDDDSDSDDSGNGGGGRKGPGRHGGRGGGSQVPADAGGDNGITLNLGGSGPAGSGSPLGGGRWTAHIGGLAGAAVGGGSSDVNGLVNGLLGGGGGSHRGIGKRRRRAVRKQRK